MAFPKHHQSAVEFEDQQATLVSWVDSQAPPVKNQHGNGQKWSAHAYSRLTKHIGNNMLMIQWLTSGGWTAVIGEGRFVATKV
jgi:hypothetical protein